jgi:hypothetical protein
MGRFAFESRLGGPQGTPLRCGLTRNERSAFAAQLRVKGPLFSATPDSTGTAADESDENSAGTCRGFVIQLPLLDAVSNRLEWTSRQSRHFPARG